MIYSNPTSIQSEVGDISFCMNEIEGKSDLGNVGERMLSRLKSR